MNYTYTISTDFPNGKVSLDRLTKEIRDSSIVTSLDYISMSGNTCDIYFKADLSGSDLSTLNGLVASHSGEPLVETPVMSSVVIDGGVVHVTKTEDTKLTIITHDFTDKTTWYQESIYVSDEVLQDSGSSHIVYNASHSYIIDTYHAKLTDEDYLVDSASRSYRVTVKIDDVVKTEQDPHYGTGGDYVVNYDSGSIEFLTPLSGSEVVKMTYHYGSSSTFTIKPPAGKTYYIDLAEVQFSIDIIARDTVTFQGKGYVQSFAPQYCPTPYPLNTLINLGDPTKYKSISDFLNVSTKSYPIYKAVGGDGWRGMPVDVNVYDWDYISRLVLDSSKGMEIQIKLEHDTPWDGYYSTAAFYGVIK